ncbi:MAG TPA: PIN domain-containing protein [Brevundimonas sp.]|nr:PIN domain-containing protein [Brevundimonas sp.]
MIAVDSSTLIDWLRNRDTVQTAALDRAMENNDLFLPPPVETEVLSFPGEQPALAEVLDDLPRLLITEGFWVRAGASRRVILKQGLKAKLADSLIAQLCLDHNAQLIATDTDFRHFVTHCGLKLAS